MKLSRDQINFIEDYLIKNKVKFWDVRMELLDHIATDVQERMHNGEVFENALKQVHLSFGNSFKSKKLSKDQKSWIFTESIYADNSGYKKLIEAKAKTLNKEVYKQLVTSLRGFFWNPISLGCYGILIISLLYGETWFYDGKLFVKCIMYMLLALTCILVLAGLMQRKKLFSSLYLSCFTILPALTMGIWNFSFSFLRLFVVGEDNEFPYWYLAVMAATMAPIIIVEVKILITKFREYQKIHKTYFT